MTQEHEFGRYIREKRLVAGMSLRALAAKLRVSHVYLGEVERGAKGPMAEKHWSRLIKVL
ncbi:MAG: helix-turn-helix transcriptional regulator, partial [Myxococcota bacterium]